MTNTIESTNRVEGPILYRTVELNVAEWKDRLNPRKTLDRDIQFDKNTDGKLNPLRKEIVDQILATQSEANDPVLEALTHPNDKSIVYRCFQRSSAEDIKIAQDNIQQYGYDNDPQLHDQFWFLNGKFYPAALWPSEDRATTSFILIYKNDPQTFPKDTTLLELRDHKKENPSLRDLLIGVVEIDWK